MSPRAAGTFALARCCRGCGHDQVAIKLGTVLRASASPQQPLCRGGAVAAAQRSGARIQRPLVFNSSLHQLTMINKSGRQ